MHYEKNYQTPTLRVVHITGQYHLLSASSSGDMSATISGYSASGEDGDGFSQAASVKGNSVNWNDDWSK